MRFHKKHAFLITALIIIVLAGFSFKQHTTLGVLENRVSTLEGQIVTLAEALQEGNAVSERNKERLRELATRKDPKTQDELLTGAVAQAAPAVVSIVVSKDVPLLEVEYVNPFGDDPYFRDFGVRVPRYKQVGTQEKQVGAGTGFLAHENGYIITNRHVVADTQARYVALLSTGAQKEAQVIYRDDTHDLALLKIPAGGYSALSLGSSSSLQLGQSVLAIGNALGEYNNSVSVGIISGLDRTIQARNANGGITTLEGVIQTDAAINQGNSGGPLLNLEGDVVGVNVATQLGANNISFAIPAEDVRPILSRILP